MPPQKNMVFHQKSTLRLQKTVSIHDLELILGKFPPDKNFPSLSLNVEMKLREFNVRKLFSLKQSTQNTEKLWGFSWTHFPTRNTHENCKQNHFDDLCFPFCRVFIHDFWICCSCVHVCFFLWFSRVIFVYLSNSSQSACVFFWACLRSLVFAGGWGRKTSLKYDLMTTITSMTMTMMRFCDLFF